ncbi:hypothetical protein ACHAPT_010761 [Fusarium lateritium]
MSSHSKLIYKIAIDAFCHVATPYHPIVPLSVAKRLRTKASATPTELCLEPFLVLLGLQAIQHDQALELEPGLRSSMRERLQQLIESDDHPSTIRAYLLMAAMSLHDADIPNQFAALKAACERRDKLMQDGAASDCPDMQLIRLSTELLRR